MEQNAIENPYGLGALIANGDIIARSILAILLIMSLLTWFIMITKFFDQRRQRKQAIEAEKEFWSSTSLTDALSKLKGNIESVSRAGRNRQAGLRVSRDQ
jgi:biopolymer transport protein ExbB